MKNFSIFKAAVAILAAVAAGCAGQAGTGTPSVGPLSSTIQEAGPFAASGRHKQLAGMYDGSIKLFEGQKTYSGTLQIKLHFHNKNILGPFRITAHGTTVIYRLGARIQSKTSGEAQIVFIIYNRKGGYATGSGTIANGAFAGTAHSITSANNPVSSLSFSVTKNPND